MSRWRAVVFGLCLAVAVTLGVMLGDRTPPYKHDYGLIDPKEPLEQAQITVTWVMREPAARVCDGWVQREIWIGQGINQSLACLYDKQPAIRPNQLKSTREDGKPDMLNRSFQLCPKAVAGPAVYRALTCYYCNPAHYVGLPICLYTPDIPFEIKSAK